MGVVVQGPQKGGRVWESEQRPNADICCLGFKCEKLNPVTRLGGCLGSVCLAVGLSGMTLVRTYLSLPSLEPSKAPIFSEARTWLSKCCRSMRGWKEPVTADQGSSLIQHKFTHISGQAISLRDYMRGAARTSFYLKPTQSQGRNGMSLCQLRVGEHRTHICGPLENVFG